MCPYLIVMAGASFVLLEMTFRAEADGARVTSKRSFKVVDVHVQSENKDPLIFSEFCFYRSIQILWH